MEFYNFKSLYICIFYFGGYSFKNFKMYVYYYIIILLYLLLYLDYFNFGLEFIRKLVLS